MFFIFRIESVVKWDNHMNFPNASEATLEDVDRKKHNKAKTVHIILWMCCMILRACSTISQHYRTLILYVLNSLEGTHMFTFMSLLQIDMTQVLKILPQVRPGGEPTKIVANVFTFDI